MTRTFNSESTADDVLEGKLLTGMRVLITGASSGLGIETARAFAAHGADVIGTVRDLDKGKRASEAVVDAAAASGSAFSLVRLDLADLESIEAALPSLTSDGRGLDVVIANAGVMATPEGITHDGFETQFGTNVVGHLALIRGLIPVLKKGGRVVVLSSAAHQIADVSLSDPGFSSTPYDPWIAYGRSKTGCALMALALDDQLRANGVRAVSVHPGAIQTGLQRHYSDEVEKAFIEQINAGNAAAGRPPFRYKTVEQGAATTVWASTASAEIVGGQYCEDCAVAEIDDSDGVHGGVRSYARNRDRAIQLVALCDEMIEKAESERRTA